MAAPRTDFYVYATTLTAIAAGAQATDNFRIDADADFVVQGILCSANMGSGVAYRSRSNIAGSTATGTVSSGVGGTPASTFESVDFADMVKLYRDANTNAAQVTNAGLHLIRLSFADNNRNWQSQPIRADLWTMEPGRELFLPVPQRITANSALTVTAYNDMPAGSNDGSANALRGFLGNAAGTAAPTITVQVALLGYKLFRA
jgi:hypothetical protein